MNPTEKENWRINLENAVVEAIVKVGYEVVKSIFRRYEAKNLETLRTCYYAEVFADLQQIIYD